MPIIASRKKAILYQESPLRRSKNPKLVPYSFTESLESYRKAARQESWIIENCNRVPTVEIVLRFHIVRDIATIRENWKRLRVNLNRIGFPFAAVIELTQGINGMHDDTIHYHFLFDTALSKEMMKAEMKAACLNSGLGVYGTDFDLLSFDIRDWGQRKIHYFTKYGKRYERLGKVRLFQKGLRIPKFRYGNGWFVEQDGTPTTKAKILKRIKNEYKQKLATTPPPADVSPFTP